MKEIKGESVISVCSPYWSSYRRLTVKAPGRWETGKSKIVQMVQPARRPCACQSLKLMTLLRKFREYSVPWDIYTYSEQKGSMNAIQFQIVTHGERLFVFFG